MYYAMEKEQNPTGIKGIDEELERHRERLAELKEGVISYDSYNDYDSEEEESDDQPGPELRALLPYYQQVEEEALKVARKYFSGILLCVSGTSICNGRNGGSRWCYR